MPWKQGFDEFVGYLHQAHAHYYYPHYIYDNDQKLPLEGNEGDGRGTYSHDVIADRTLQFIEKNKDQPFFCYAPFTIPHSEYVAPEDSMAEYRGKFEEIELPEHRTRPGRLIRPEEPHAALAAMITRLDRDVGRIMNLLDDLGLDGNTIVFFTSDNGAAAANWTGYFQSSGPLRGAKRTFYEGGIRVPMIARWPGRIAAGSASDLPWAFHDVLPTAVFHDLMSGSSTTVLDHPECAAWDARFSPDGRWFAFHCSQGPDRRQIFVAPFEERRVERTELVPITELGGNNARAAWSPDGNGLYYLAVDEGAVYGQRLEPSSKHPTGDPVRIFAADRAQLSLRRVRNPGYVGLAVAADKLVLTMAELRGNVWLLQPQSGK